MDTTTPPRIPATGKKWRWVYLAAALCVLSWIALGAGIALQVGTGAMLVLTTLAALTTEGVVWLTALMFGISAYGARRELWGRLFRRGL